MAIKKISALTLKSSLGASDLVAIVDEDTTPATSKRIRVTDLVSGGLPSEISVNEVYQNKPFSYGGKRIDIVNPYVSKDNEYQGQLHCHSDESDGNDTPTEVVTAYKNAGYDFISLTDHDKKTADPSVSGILFIPGVEETTDDGHITSTNPTTAVSGSVTQTVIDAIVSDGAIPGMAHPNNNAVGIKWTDEELESVGGYFNIEIYNAYAGGAANAEDKWDTLLSKFIRCSGVAVDDNHNIADAYFDKGWVQAFADTATVANITDSIKRGNFYSSTGPDLSITASGKVITASTGDAGTIAFIGYSASTLQTESSVTSASYIALGHEIYVRIKITRDSDSKNAWSNPIYIHQVSTTSTQKAGLVRGNQYITGDSTVSGSLIVSSSAQFGYVGIGIAPNANYPLYVSACLSASATNQIGIYNFIYLDPTDTNSVNPKGFNTTVYSIGTKNFTGTVSGVGGFYRHRGTGVVTQADALVFGIQLENNTGSITTATVINVRGPTWVDGNKTIGTERGVWIRDQGNAKITTSYGLAIDNQTGSGTIFSIHTGTGLVSLGGNLTFRQATTLANLSGDITINPAAKVYITGTPSDTVGATGGTLSLGSDNPYWTFRQATTALADLCIDRFYASSYTEVLRLDRSTGMTMFNYPIQIKELGAALADVATYGQIWVKNDDPNVPRYTNGDGTDFTMDITAV